MTFHEYDLVFVDAPHVLEPVDLTGHGTSLDALGAHEASTTSEDPALKPRGWWRSDATRMRTDGLEESLAFLRDILRTQRFEVRRQLSRECGDLMRMDLALLRALDIICRGSLALGEASRAHKVSCPHDLIPPFVFFGVRRRQSRRGIGGPPSGSCAAILFSSAELFH
jgi:hypothetical protein